MSKPSRTKRTQQVGEALAGYLAHAGLAERVAQADVVLRWPELVGAQVAQAAQAESVTPDGMLYVRVRSSAWRQELSLMTPQIMAKLNAGRKKGRITKIFWLVGSGSGVGGAGSPAGRIPDAGPRTPDPGVR